MNRPHPAPSGPGLEAPEAAVRPQPRVVDSQVLLSGASLLLIRHQGEIYRLQTTRQGKLILTK